MSLQHAAKHLAAHGRGPDTTLVHMSKEEVKSLNDIAMAHGGHLTINPHTGLPEAGFLSRMLPMIAGGALAATTGIPAWQAGLMVGGGYAAATGSLKKGLMAGLGAYGGAGMAASLGEAGAASVVPEAAPTPAPVVDATPVPVNPPVTPPQTYSSPFEGTGVDASNFAKPAEVPGFNAPKADAIVDASGNVSRAPVVTNLEPAAPVPAPAPASVEPVGQYAGKFAASPSPVQAANTGLGGTTNGYTPPEADYSKYVRGGAQDMATGNATPATSFKDMTPSQRFEAMKSGASFDNLGKWASDNKYQAYGMGASALMPWDEDPQQRTPYHDSDPGQQYTYEANPTGASNPDPRGHQQNYFNQRYVPRAADGGLMARGGNVHGTLRPPPTFFQNGKYSFHPSQMYADGGLSDAQYNLGGYSDGGRLLRGPGDGVSDSIPATIGHKQPARLADGEFVVPARIVSELGNGSTEAGARKLYAMMDRIQKTRGSTVGKGKVAKNSRADKYLPA